MNVSVIIPSLYEVDGEYLKLCVESLRATTDWQIIVVTNGSKIKPDLTDIRGISTHLHTSDQGQCNAVNIGAQVAQGDYLMVSNSDMYYAPGWNKNLLNRYEKSRDMYLCWSPNLIEPINNAGSAPPFVKVDGGNSIEDFDKKKVDLAVSVLVNEEKGTGEGGFNLPFMMNRKLWDFLGGYDIVYDPWSSNSDTDLQTRINLAGVMPRRLRDVLVYHFSNKAGTFDGTHQEAYQFNIDYFKDKFGFDRDELGSDVWYNKDMIPEDKERINYDQKPYMA